MIKPKSGMNLYQTGGGGAFNWIARKVIMKPESSIDPETTQSTSASTPGPSSHTRQGHHSFASTCGTSGDGNLNVYRPLQLPGSSSWLSPIPSQPPNTECPSAQVIRKLSIASSVTIIAVAGICMACLCVYRYAYGGHTGRSIDFILWYR
jgi:hypothetical protein